MTLLFTPFPVVAPFLFAVAILNFSLGFWVLLQSRKSPNLLFFLFTACVAVWCFGLASISSGISIRLMILGSYLTVLGGLPVPYFFLLLSTCFPSGKISIPKSAVLLLAIPSLVLILFARNLIEISITGEMEFVVSLLNLNILYALHFMFYFLISAGIIFINFTRASRTERIRYKYFLLGIFLTVGISIISNLILVVFWGIDRFKYFGPLSTIFMIGFTAYSILKYRLFDIMIIIKKTTAYSLVTTGITFSYVLVVLAFEFISRAIWGYSSFWAAVPASLVIAVTFVPLRDRLQGVT